MKKKDEDEPTDLDREAAIFFKPARGMRVRTTYEPREWGVVLFYAEDEDGLWPDAAAWTPGGANNRVHLFERIEALDTDDPATVGCMIDQVEQAEGNNTSVEVYRMSNEWYWFTQNRCGRDSSTRGAALVAAMKALKGVK